MENQIDQSIMKEIIELRTQNKKAFELINANQISISNQNHIISNLKDRNDSLSEELECIKKGSIKPFLLYLMFIVKRQSL